MIVAFPDTSSLISSSKSVLFLSNSVNSIFTASADSLICLIMSSSVFSMLVNFLMHSCNYYFRFYSINEVRALGKSHFLLISSIAASLLSIGGIYFSYIAIYSVKVLVASSILLLNCSL